MFTCSHVCGLTFATLLQLWKNARCLNEKEEAISLREKAAPKPPIPFGEDPPGVTRAAWHDGEEKKTDPEPPSSPESCPPQPPRTWRYLAPSEWYIPSTKREDFFECEEAGFHCLSYHCARQCINGNFKTRLKNLKRAETRLANKQKRIAAIEELRADGNTEGDVKRYTKQVSGVNKGEGGANTGKREASERVLSRFEPHEKSAQSHARQV